MPLRSTPGAVGSIFMSLIQLKTPKTPYVPSFSAIKTGLFVIFSTLFSIVYLTLLTFGSTSKSSNIVELSVITQPLPYRINFLSYASINVAVYNVEIYYYKDVKKYKLCGFIPFLEYECLK